MAQEIKKQPEFGTEAAENLCQDDRLFEKYYAAMY